MTPPRSILKPPSPSFQLHAPHHPAHAVHFPPSSSLTCTFTAYSAAIYDRSPIDVTPNSCALPERGCPGRTYSLDDPSCRRSNTLSTPPSNGRDLHPHALAFNQSPSSSRCNDPIYDRLQDDPQRTPTPAYPELPPLIPDVSSESEESDSSSCTPTEPSSIEPYFDARLNRLSISDTALSIAHVTRFIDYSPYTSYTSDSSHYPLHSTSEDEIVQKTLRPRPRRRERSRDRDRIRGDQDLESTSSTACPPSKRCSALKRGSARFGVSKLAGGFASEEQASGGCLDGF